MAELYGFTPNISGIRSVLKSPAVQSELSGIIQPMVGAANGNAQLKDAEYKGYVDVGSYTAIGKVVCGNAAARHDNSRHNTLLKSMR